MTDTGDPRCCPKCEMPMTWYARITRYVIEDGKTDMVEERGMCQCPKCLRLWWKEEL